MSGELPLPRPIRLLSQAPDAFRQTRASVAAGILLFSRQVGCSVWDSQIRNENPGATQNPKRVDLIKMGAEGEDLEVTAGAKQATQRFRPAVLLENNPPGRSAAGLAALLAFMNQLECSIQEDRNR